MRNRLVRAPITATWLWAALGWAIALNVVVPKVSAADIDIREFGARCDGSDDAYAVQSALDALTDGSRLAVPCRAGIGPTGIRLRRKNAVIVEGSDGGGFFALAGNADNALFGVEYCDNCTLRFLAIDSRNLPVAGISINYSNNAHIEGNTIENVAYPAFGAIIGLGNRGNAYTWNTISRTGVYRVNGAIADGSRGIWIGNPKDIWIEWNAVITNNKILDTGASAIAVNGVGAIVTDNYVEVTQGSGVKITPPAGLGGRTVVMRNTIRNARFSGVQIDSATTAPTLIAENILEKSAIAGVYAAAGLTDGEITANRISDSGEAGIYIYDANGVIIQENEINGGKTGIAFEAIRPGAIQDVRMHGNTVAGLSGNGLVLLGRGGSMRGMTLASNAFSNIKQYGMQIEEVQSGEIVGPNLIANCFSNIGAGTLLDLRPSPLLAPTAMANCSRPPQTRFRPLRINVGGKTYVDPKRQAWLEDSDLVEGHLYDLTDMAIKNTSTPELYRSGRWKEGSLDFAVEVPNRVYTVTLKFAEPYFQSRGMRVFDIYINDELVLPRFDILSHVGPFEALDRSFQVTVNTGKLAIHMVAHADDPMICAIEIQ